MEKFLTGLAPIYTWAPMSEIEDAAREQLLNVAALPWVFHHVAVMPDVHFGIGCTVGSVIAMENALAPAAVGVDIGCGMAAIPLPLVANDLPSDLAPLRHSIERTIPVAHNGHKIAVVGAFPDAVKHMNDMKLLTRFSSNGYVQRATSQMGTLGGGNHFIEICLDEVGGVWLMLHSGSRNIGKELASHHIEVAKKLAHNVDVPDPDLAVFLAGTPEMKAYRADLTWAQQYAWLNRKVMLELLWHDLQFAFPQLQGLPLPAGVQCHHNYVSEETHFGKNLLVTRKGAISAKKGEMGIIPGSMGTPSYIVEGLGNPDSFNSASHGAGRRMSRGQARRTFTLEDLAKQTEGVECRKDKDVLDESPGAYKEIETVIAQQADLVKVVHKLKQVLTVKG